MFTLTKWLFRAVASGIRFLFLTTAGFTIVLLIVTNILTASIPVVFDAAHMLVRLAAVPIRAVASSAVSIPQQGWGEALRKNSDQAEELAALRTRDSAQRTELRALLDKSDRQARELADTQRLLRRQKEEAAELGRVISRQREEIASIGTKTKLIREQIASSSTRIYRRLAIGITRGIASVPAESVPIIGSAVVIGGMALDVQDACAVVEEMQELINVAEAALSSSPVEPDEMGRYCGLSTEDLKSLLYQQESPREACIRLRFEFQLIDIPECDAFPTEAVTLPDLGADLEPPVLPRDPAPGLPEL